jgi:beta-fructofuranosidase
VKKLKPILASDWWLIGANPDLRGILPGEEEDYANWEAKGKEDEHNAAVDHHLFRDDAGTYHLWGCIRGTAVGRVLYHWKSDDLKKERWEETGEIIRRDEKAGESIRDWSGQEWLQSPHFIRHDGLWYMFYGGHSTGCRANGEPITANQVDLTTCQMCLMTSTDGLDWSRHRNADGFSRVFVAPGEVRDPCVIRVGDEWLCYYAGFKNEDRKQHAFFVRRSKNLVNWSDYSIALEHPEDGKGPWSTECPHVVYREGYYYLFRTESYYDKITHVYRSEDPLCFGIGEEAAKKRIGYFPAGAVEIYEFDGQEYVTSSHNPKVGEFMAKLDWVPDEN